MSDELLARACPACGAAYGEHTLDGLAACVESLLGDYDDFECYPYRPVETVTGPTLELVL